MDGTDEATADLRSQSAALVARARANTSRSRELIDSSLSLIGDSLQRRRTRPVPHPRELAAGELSLRTAVALTGLGATELWIAHIGIGGDCSPHQLRSFLAGGPELPAHERRILVHVVNEHFWQQGISSPIVDG